MGVRPRDTKPQDTRVEALPSRLQDAGSIPAASTMYAVVSGCKKLLEMPSRNGFGVFTRCTGLKAAACCGAPYKSILSATAANGSLRPSRVCDRSPRQRVCSCLAMNIGVGTSGDIE